jgi:hypothetical protein
MGASQRNVTICGSRLQPPRHICCFFETRDQQYQALVPYLAEGLSQGERVMAVMDSDLIADHDRRLVGGGIAVDEAKGSGRLSAFSTDDTYLKGGSFAKQRMLGMLREELERTAASGYAGLRTFGDMAWILRNMPGTEEALEYESEVNALLHGHEASFLCVYDANRISGAVMRDVLNTHSHVLMGGIVYENPYYLSPQDYRRSLSARRSATTDMLGSNGRLTDPGSVG